MANIMLFLRSFHKSQSSQCSKFTFQRPECENITAKIPGKRSWLLACSIPSGGPSGGLVPQMHERIRNSLTSSFAEAKLTEASVPQQAGQNLAIPVERAFLHFLVLRKV